MKSHALARKLLEMPDLDVAMYANGHVYCSAADRNTHGLLKIGVLEHYAGQHIVVGNISKMNINKPNWFVSKMLYGKARKEW